MGIPAPVGVAMLGAGHIAEYHLAGLAAAGGACVRVIAGRSERNAAGLAQRFGIPDVETDWRRVLDRREIDAVVIATPDDTHEPIAIAAAQAGKAILLQKPMAASVSGARRIVDAAARHGVDLQVSFMHRFFAEVEQARVWLREEVIGRVHSVRLRNATPGPDWNDWFFDRARVGNGVVDQLGVHGIDLALALVGDVEAVSARMATVVPKRTLRDGRTVDVHVCDSAWALYSFAGGAVGSHEMSMVEAQGCDRFRMELYGERGTLWLRSERGPIAAYAPARFGDRWHVPSLDEAPMGARQHAAWIDGITGRAPRLATAQAALRGMQVVEAIARSNEQHGAAVRVEARS
ncbi:MAG TPA: Gfo/Idh/MocA family oxidoreductase [Casimicrobiaceae bacterium]|jgi:predicted dehydrogenase